MEHLVDEPAVEFFLGEDLLCILTKPQDLVVFVEEYEALPVDDPQLAGEVDSFIKRLTFHTKLHRIDCACRNHVKLILFTYKLRLSCFYGPDDELVVHLGQRCW